MNIDDDECEMRVCLHLDPKTKNLSQFVDAELRLMNQETNKAHQAKQWKNIDEMHELKTFWFLLREKVGKRSHRLSFPSRNVGMYLCGKICQDVFIFCII